MFLNDLPINDESPENIFANIEHIKQTNDEPEHKDGHII